LINPLNFVLLAFLGVPVPQIATEIISTPRTASTVPTVLAQKSLDPSTLPERFTPVAEADIGQDPLPIAKSLPNDLLGIAVLNFNSQYWDEVDQFNPFGIKALDALAKMNRLPEGMSFREDMQPWLGERIAIAVFQTPERKDFAVIVFMPIADGNKYQAFFAKAIAIQKLKPIYSQYKGATIWEWETKDSTRSTASKCHKSQLDKLFSDFANKQNLKCGGNAGDNDFFGGFRDFDIFGFNGNGAVMATLPNGYLAITNSRESLEQLIDTQVSLLEGNAKIPLTENALFQRTVKNPLWQRSLFAGYGDNKRLMQFLEGQIARSSTQANPDSKNPPDKKPAVKPPTENNQIDPFEFSDEEMIRDLRRSAEEYTSFDGYFWVSPQGLHSQSNAYYTKPHVVLPASVPRDRILSLLPANSYASISSQNFKQQWQWLKQEIQWQPSLGFLYALMRESLTSTFGVDIDKDIAPWIDREYAAILFPSDRGLFKTFGFDLAIASIIQTSNPLAANAALAKVEQKIMDLADGLLIVSKREVGGVQVTSWEMNDNDNKAASQSVFAYGWKDKNTLVMATGIGPIATVIATPKNSLAESDLFKAAIANMPQPNFGYFYMDAQRLVRLAVIGFNSLDGTFTESLIPPKVKQFLDSLGGLVAAYSQTPEKLQSDTFLGLKPIKK
jgi:hypothetical protein